MSEDLKESFIDKQEYHSGVPSTAFESDFDSHPTKRGKIKISSAYCKRE